MTLNIPNILTILRLIAAPAVVFLFLFITRPWADWFALVLFIGAALTDFLDGYLARAWKQETKLGAMLDPIADKAMVIIALFVIASQSNMNFLILAPATIIIFREVFVSGLREFLGDTAGTLKVTNLAKWKTTAQMIAIALLFAAGVFEHYFGIQSLAMTQQMVTEAIDGTGPDYQGLRWKYYGMLASGWGGIGMLWIAALLTFVTGADYFRKATPYLKDNTG
ncbi:CDP-diacylglycerol--glycerol-3-phosphate 3-phosphatidyltransferase [Yoonia sp. BS5-3]|uniref:CDP-diacylglycerol--glycerol-3-phosphate 3-phosphatidyltransferase n=1 Tax=Yoonia phaeophyticola TaxID=3137369 RepID=A0ABZ2V718_9RHOB